MTHISTTLDAKIAEAEFAGEAARAFMKDPKLSTYARTHTGGQFLALRWGIMDRTVRVLKLDPDWIPVNYIDAIARPKDFK